MVPEKGPVIMEIEKAIEILRYSVCDDSTGRDCGKYTCCECHTAHDIAAGILEKRIPKTAIIVIKPGSDLVTYKCPRCGNGMSYYKIYENCPHCTQAIDWTGETGE